VTLDARIAFDTLRRDGLTAARIAGISKTSTSAVRLWVCGIAIPSGAAIRLIAAARMLNALTIAPCPAIASRDSDELATFARGWLAANAQTARHDIGSQELQLAAAAEHPPAGNGVNGRDWPAIHVWPTGDLSRRRPHSATSSSVKAHRAGAPSHGTSR
jgi:hypothetical protein